MAWYFLVWFDFLWYGNVALHGIFWYGLVFYGMALHGMVFLVWFGFFGMVWHYIAWHGIACMVYPRGRRCRGQQQARCVKARSQSPCQSEQKCTEIKGTVSRDLRWVLLYIIRKLFSRAIVAHHKILIYNLKRRSSVRTAQQF